MKKYFFFLLTLFTLSAAAQDSTLKEYVGIYKFAEGSPVTSAEIYLKNNALTVNSAHGSSAMEKRGRDTFALPTFEGMAYFTRNNNGQVAGVRVEVGEYVLQGIKDNVITFFNRKRYYIAARNPLVK